MELLLNYLHNPFDKTADLALAQVLFPTALVFLNIFIAIRIGKNGIFYYAFTLPFLIAGGWYFVTFILHKLIYGG